MAINVLRIFLTHQKLHFHYYSVQGVLFNLITVLGSFQSLCNYEIFVKLNLPPGGNLTCPW